MPVLFCGWCHHQSINKKGSSDILMGTPNMLCLSTRKNNHPQARGWNGHPLAIGLIATQHGLKAEVKAEERSDSPEGLGLELCFGHAIVITGDMGSFKRPISPWHNILYRPIRMSEDPKKN